MRYVIEMVDLYRYKGDAAGLVAKHHWVKRRKQKTGVCSRCGERRYTEWANIDHKYSRNLDDYIELCKPCHIKHDGTHKTPSGWNKGKKVPQLSRPCPPGCTCGRHTRSGNFKT